MRIAVAGFQHETNTFAPTPTDFRQFQEGGGFPGLQRGGAMRDTMAGRNLPVSGALALLDATRHSVIPTTWAAAEPGARVTRDAFERIASMILEDLRAAAPDAVYLDLHGAMATEHHDDGEGELLARIRAALGDRVPVVASLDLHANVTRRMLACSDLMVAYRTYPHVDMAETGERAAHLLLKLFDGMPRPHAAVRRMPFLIPIVAQCTDLEPARGLYARLTECERGAASLSLTMGFPATDFAECGPVVFAYGASPAQADAVATELAAEVEACESRFGVEVLAAGDAVRAASARYRGRAPVVIADAQDNPGAGGDSDTTGVLRAMLAQGVERAALGLIADGAAAQAAHAAGRGSVVELALGGKSRVPGDAPLVARFRVEALSDGHVVCDGPFYRGARMSLGPSACLAIEGVRIVVTSRKAQLADRAMFEFVGIDPLAQCILVVKSSVHFRADFTPLAETILVARSPGPMLVDPAEFPWRALAPGMRLGPGGPAFAKP